MEERLREVRALAWKAQKKWSADQEIYVQEVSIHPLDSPPSLTGTPR